MPADDSWMETASKKHISEFFCLFFSDWNSDISSCLFIARCKLQQHFPEQAPYFLLLLWGTIAKKIQICYNRFNDKKRFLSLERGVETMKKGCSIERVFFLFLRNLSWHCRDSRIKSLRFALVILFVFRLSGQEERNSSICGNCCSEEDHNNFVEFFTFSVRAKGRTVQGVYTDLKSQLYPGHTTSIVIIIRFRRRTW